jgi:predicted DNA-binding transcriptional regulator AlpA
MNRQKAALPETNVSTLPDPIVPGWNGASRVSGRSTASLKRDVRKGTFPAPMRLGENQVGWRLSWIEAWANHLPRLGRPPPRVPQKT